MVGKVPRRRDLRAHECAVAVARRELAGGNRRRSRKLRAAANDAGELEERHGTGENGARVRPIRLDHEASGLDEGIERSPQAGADRRDVRIGDIRGLLLDLAHVRDRGPELTRPARALKLWASVRTFGLAAFRAAIAHGIALAEHAEAQLRERDDWQVVTPAQLGIVTFRRDGLDDDGHTRLSAATVADGYAAPSTTVVGSRVVLRLCTINPRTRFEEVDATLDRMEALAKR